MNPDAAASVSAPLAPTAAKNSAFKAILCAGLLAGALDISYVFIFLMPKNVGPGRVLRGIASGLLGREKVAACGAEAMAALGLGIHFAIATGAAAVFYLFSRKWRYLAAQPLVCGLYYGVLVFLVMNLVVLPLSATPPKAFPPRSWISLLTAHVFCVGLPIATVVWWFSRPRAGAASISPA